MDLTNPAPIPGNLELKPNEATLVTVLHERSLLHPEKRAFVFLADGSEKEISITYGELDLYARRAAVKLTEIGLKGKKVLMFYPSGIDFIVAFFGCLIAGVIPVPLYPPRKNRSLQRVHSIASNCGSLSILTTTDISLTLERNFAEDPFLKNLSWHSTETWSISDDPVPAFAEPLFDDLAFLQYTSGSTGDPKGVMVSHRNIMYNLRSLQMLFQIDSNDITVNWVPQFHDLGLIFGIMETVFSGIFAVLIAPVNFISDPSCMLRAVTRYRATITGQPDFAFNLCADKISDLQLGSIDLSSLKVLYSGAEPVRKTTFERFVEVFSPAGIKPTALHPGYGMAESTLVLTGIKTTEKPFYLPVRASSLEKNKVEIVPEDDVDVRWITSNGRSFLDTAILIVNPETREILPADSIGEIWVRGSIITMGYYNQPALTREVFGVSPAGRDEPFWLRTGDLSFLYDDELYITGRLKDLIIIRGRNLYPQDIEKTVEESHASVRKTCAAAFSMEQDGKEGLAIVAELRRSIIRPDTNKIMDAIVSAVSLEFEVRPVRIALIRTGSLLKTSSGKTMRRAMRGSLLSGKMDIIADRSFEDLPQTELSGTGELDLEHFLVTWVSHHLNNGLPADPLQSLATYGIDSLKAVELTDDTKNVFGFEWPPYLFFEEISIRQLTVEGHKLMEEQ